MRNYTENVCPYCRIVTKRLLLHVERRHSDLDTKENLILKVFGLNEWPTYEINGITKKYIFDRSHRRFVTENRSDGLKIAYIKNPEFKLKVVKSIHERNNDPEYRKRFSEAIKRSCSDPNVLEHKRSAALNNWKNEEYRTKVTNSRIRLKRSEEFCRHQSELMKSRMKNPEFHKKIKDAKQRYFEEHGHYAGYFDPEYFKYRNKSRQEAYFIEKLKSFGISVISNNNHYVIFDENLNRCNCYPDILINYKDNFMLVEFDGLHWHTMERLDYELNRDYWIYKLYKIKICRISNEFPLNKNLLTKKLNWTLNNKPYFEIYKNKDLIYQLKSTLDPIDYFSDLKLLTYETN